jgi:fructokinase
MRVLCFGEVLWDHIEKEYHLGGAPLNFAAHSAQFGSESSIISAVGKDDLGEKTLEGVRKVNVKTDLIALVPQPTGVVEVTMNRGIPSYEIVEGTAWDNIALSPEREALIRESDWDLFYMGSLAQRSEANSRILHEKILPRVKARIVFFDANLRQHYYTREVMEKSLTRTTILKLNDEELPVISELLYGEKLDPEALFGRMKSLSSKLELLILTKGPDGADIISDKGLQYFPIESDVPVVDTVGAGDSYSGSFCFAYFHTGDISRSARFAQDVADRVVSQPGALPDYGETIMAESRRIAEGL